MRTKGTAVVGISCYQKTYESPKASGHGQLFPPCSASSAWNSQQMSFGFPYDKYQVMENGKGVSCGLKRQS